MRSLHAASQTIMVACRRVNLSRYSESSILQTRYGESLPEDTWTSLLSLTTSMLLIGAFCASLVFKLIINVATRGQVMILTHVCNLTGYVIVSIGMDIWGSYEAFIAGRFVTGLALGFGLGK